MKLAIGAFLMVLSLGLHLGVAWAVLSTGRWDEPASTAWGLTYGAIVLVPLLIGAGLILWEVMTDD